MDETLDARLASAGVDATTSIGATIRPTLADASLGATLESAPSAAALPRLSVDLDGLEGGAREAPPSLGSDLEVRGVLGEGGMGRVLVARQRSLARDVALKTTKDPQNTVAASALLAEGAITGQLEHPAIVPVHLLGLDAGGRPTIVMKRIEGVAWRALWERADHEVWDDWPGKPDDRLPGHLAILMQVANALHFAHSRGFVHRDVKLDNVLIGRFGDVYLADWGVATRVGTREPHLVGTPGYMAREMAGGGLVDERTDVYLLGATLHEILTGRQRHDRDTVAQAILCAWLSEPYAYGPEVPADLAALANAACDPDPAKRPQSPRAFRDAIAAHLAHRELAALARDATARVDRLEALAALSEPTLEERAELDRLAAEASFAFERAFAGWPGDEPSRAAHARLEALLGARRERAAALERDAHQRDPRVSAMKRALGLALLALAGGAISAVALAQAREPTPIEAVLYPVATLVALVVGTAVFRRAAFRTRVNRDLTLILHVLMLLVLLGRALGLLVEVPLAHHFARDSFALAAAGLIAAIAYLRWFAWVALFYAACGVVCTLVPSAALPAFALTTAFSIAVAAVFQWLEARAAVGPRAPPS